MVLYRMILAANELKRVMIADHVDRCSRANSFLSSLASQKNFDVHHIMLDNCLRIVIFRSVEDDITWSHLFFLQNYWQGIKLVALIPRPQPKAKVFSQIVYSFPDKSTAVKK